VKAHGSGLHPSARLAATEHTHADGILAGLRWGLTTARAEATNTKVRLITRRAHELHSAAVAIVLIMLTCGPVHRRPPHEGVTADPHGVQECHFDRTNVSRFGSALTGALSFIGLSGMMFYVVFKRRDWL
jgi:hypothetical protein